MDYDTLYKQLMTDIKGSPAEGETQDGNGEEAEGTVTAPEGGAEAGTEAGAEAGAETPEPASGAEGEGEGEQNQAD